MWRGGGKAAVQLLLAAPWEEGAVPHVSLAFVVRFVIPVCERCRGGIDDNECDPDCTQPGLAVRVD